MPPALIQTETEPERVPQEPAQHARGIHPARGLLGLKVGDHATHHARIRFRGNELPAEIRKQPLGGECSKKLFSNINTNRLPLPRR